MIKWFKNTSVETPLGIMLLFLPHTTPCFGPWELGGCKSHFCPVSVLLQVF